MIVKCLIRLKGHFYEMRIRPASLYNASCWAMNKLQEAKVHVTEMCMLKWMHGVIRKERISNEYMRKPKDGFNRREINRCHLR